jgi:hypothetical protein
MHPLDRRIVDAICVLGARGVPYAELRRMLAPLARKIASPLPAYTTVRRIAITERAAADAKTEAVEQILVKLLQGRPPTPYELQRLREAHLYANLIRTLAP